MPQSHPRRDGYGRPLPELADAREEVLYASENNQEKRRLIQTLIDEYLHQLLRRGINAEVTLRFVVADGSVQGETHVGVTRRWGTPPGWRQRGEGR